MKLDRTLYIIVVLIATLVIGGCSDLRDPGPTNSPSGLSVHPPAWLRKESQDFHGVFIRNMGWDLKGCQECHGTNYAGGIANNSCLSCHAKTPEDCIVCHGGVDNTSGAPPEDLDGNTDTAATGVGAHSAHLDGNELADGFACETCHVVPDSLYASGHIDPEEAVVHAEITFGELALSGGASPQWNGQSCSNTYCHGSFEGGLAGNTPLWTVVNDTQAECGSCHQLPPGGDHPQGEIVSECRRCHNSVVGNDNNIHNRALHVNGVTDTEVHPSEWLVEGSPDFHGRFIRNSQWDLQECQLCHGSDYTGGLAESSCLTCHPSTPEDCIVCHGGVETFGGAPPEDLDGNIASSSRGVGAHTAHLVGRLWSNGFECQTCHVVPSSFDAVGHVDSDLPAELVFSQLALADGANPQWDDGSLSCSSSYCHGNWSLAKAESQTRFQFVYTAESMSGNLGAPTWTDPATGSCGTCHGLPPTGHRQFLITECGTCHSSVMDDKGRFIDKSKHVNGQVNVFGQEYPMF